MEESPIKFPNGIPSIPIEIVSDDEMALVEAALAATRSSFSSSSISAATSSSSRSSLFCSFSSSQFQRNARSIGSITRHAKRRLSVSSEGLRTGDIEDLGNLRGTKKKIKVPESFFHQFRRKKGLSVTDITASEWCEKKEEFALRFGKPKITKAMKAGRDRHARLEDEVLKKAKVRVKSAEDFWASKFMNFIICANQLSLEGLTREMPLIGFVEGVWMVGVIDEIRMPVTKTVQNPSLVDTKTRSQATPPTEPQKRNGRLQLMCYKYLWDYVVTVNFPTNQFFNFFRLNPRNILSEEIQDRTATAGFPAKTLEDLVAHFQSTCCTLRPAHDQLLLRYEFQGNQSLLGEDQFTYDSDWFKNQIKRSLEFWLGEREAGFVPKEEQWKCQYCQFASVCPSNTTADSTPPS